MESDKLSEDNSALSNNRIKTLREFYGYKEGLKDAQSFWDTHLDTSRTYTAEELKALLETWIEKHITSIGQNTALIRALQKQEARSIQRNDIVRIHKELHQIVNTTNILTFWDINVFLKALFTIETESSKILYGQYEQFQRSNNILAIIYLDVPYKLYTIFVKEGNTIRRYTLHQKHKKTPQQQPTYDIDMYVNMRISHPQYLQKIYKKHLSLFRNPSIDK